MRSICLLRRGVLSLAFAAVLPAAPIQWTAASGGNDNWYEYVSTGSIFNSLDFATAKAGAAAKTHLGLNGYLATVTSAAENDFIATSLPFLVGFGGGSGAFLGASDEAVEGEFRWLGGPEAGDLLSFTDWAAGQPTGLTDALSLGLNYSSPPVSYFWMDVADFNFGYIVEYGDGRIDQQSPVPEPSTLALAVTGIGGLLWWRRRRA
jgi:hypothetical protein